MAVSSNSLQVTARRSAYCFFLIFAASLYISWSYGYFLVDESLKLLAGQVLKVESEGGYFLPGSASLSRVTFFFKVKSGLFVGLSIGFFLTTIISFFYLAVTLLKQGLARTSAFLYLSAIILSMSQLYGIASYIQILPDFISIRDRVLMPSAPGRAVVEFYYRYSPYATFSIMGEHTERLQFFIRAGLFMMPVFLLLSLTLVNSNIILKFIPGFAGKTTRSLKIVLILSLLFCLTGRLSENRDIQWIQQVAMVGGEVAPDNWGRLLQLAGADGSGLRYEAVHAIAVMAPDNRYQCGEQCYNLLLERLHDRLAHVRIWAAVALGGLGLGGEPLKRAAADDLCINVRYKSVEALARIGDKKVVPFLQERLKKDSWYVGIYINQALAALGAR